ncbi:hypothetical protein DAETH_40830 (plasmid) [Deinococcus aetherius]|uniref:Uncharacterized protein n=1 Tax=Deinococcus aetherius TaxID=200252 RepID=A0ABM8AJW9_9DEIO|nr:hypothetical protein [Deinococcus aetherius]BDP44114.1 hypothetical protein DAETH_40830 [Deinococcus aetherius]
MEAQADTTERTRELIAQALTAVARRPTPERVRAVQRLRDDFLQVRGAAQSGKLAPTQAEPRMQRLGERAEELLSEVSA